MNCILDEDVIYSRIQNGPCNIIEDEYSSRVINFLLKREKASLLSLAENLYITKENLKYKILRKLQYTGFIQEKEKGLYTLKYKYKPCVSRIIAIEVKLKDWWAGYKQARRYLHFAHQSYLAIDNDYKNSINKDILLQNNLGLISVNEQSIRIECHPKTILPKDQDMFLLANEKIFSSLLNGKYQLPHKANGFFACVG